MNDFFKETAVCERTTPWRLWHNREVMCNRHKPPRIAVNNHQEEK